MFTALAAGVAAAAVGSAVQGGINYAAQSSANATNEKTFYDRLSTDIQMHAADYQYNAAAAEAAHKRQKDLIDYQSPVNQVQRLMDAGINPIGAAGGITAAPQAGSAPQASAGSGLSTGLPHMQASQLNGLPESLESAISNAIKAKEADTGAKRAEAQNNLDFARIDEVRANTKAIEDGNIRNEDLFTFQLLQAQESLTNVRNDNALKAATVQNIKVRTQHLLIQGQEVFNNILTSAIQLEQQRFGQSIQAAGIQIQADKAKAEVASMSLSQLIDYSKEFGILTTFSSGASASSGKSHTSGAKGSFSVSAESPSLAKPFGKFSGSAGLDLDSSDTNSENYGLTSNSSHSYRQIREETLKPMLAALRLLEEIQKDPFNVSLGRAVSNLSNYLNTNALIAVKNFMMLQGQIQSFAPSVVNPSGVDTYSE